MAHFSQLNEGNNFYLKHFFWIFTPLEGLLPQNGANRHGNGEVLQYAQNTKNRELKACRLILFMVLGSLGSKEHHIIGFECGKPFNRNPQLHGVKGRDLRLIGINTNFLHDSWCILCDTSDLSHYCTGEILFITVFMNTFIPLLIFIVDVIVLQCPISQILPGSIFCWHVCLVL